ncbi:MAG: MFS transporter [Candidatus Nanoarchaeia archaeon]|jgi:MFS family permease
MFKKFKIKPVDAFWAKLMALSLALFFIFFADGLLSYWVPGFIQSSIGSAFVMGLIMAFSSFIGLLTDLLLPQMLKNINIKNLLFIIIVLTFIFALVLIFSIQNPLIIIFLFAMFIWGIYFELIGFINHEFVSTSIPSDKRTGAWAIISLFSSLAYFLAPLLALFLLEYNDYFLVVSALFLTIISYFIFLLLKIKGSKTKIDTKEVSIFEELKYWMILGKTVWPIVITKFALGVIDASFWTIGAVLSEKLVAQKVFLASLYLPFFTLPTLLMGFILVSVSIDTQKKKLSELFLIISSFFLILMGLNHDINWQLVCVLAIGVMHALAWPLTDAVYSDILSRMGNEKKHLIGISNSVYSLAYIIGPILAGLLSSFFGEYWAFSLIGIFILIFSIILLIFTPKKLRVPQNEIKTWD